MACVDVMMRRIDTAMGALEKQASVLAGRGISLDYFSRTKDIDVEYTQFTRMYVRLYPSQKKIIIANVSVAKEARGRGIFTDLLSDLRSRYDTVVVECVNNPRHHRFYERLGFSWDGDEHSPDFVWGR